MLSRLRAGLEDFGQLILFGGETLAWTARPPWRWELLLGQMAAADYVDKLPILYEEFVESARFHAGQWSVVGPFLSAKDLMGKTAAFWEKTVLPRMERDFGGVYRYLNDPYPDGPNSYLEGVLTNLERIKRAVRPPGITRH